jgi:hypothetical protein
MSRLVGLLFIATGLLCHFVDLLLVGAMLGITTPIYSWMSLVVFALYSAGPSLLIVAGVTKIFGNARRSILCLLTSLVIVGSVAAWSVPRIGWRDTTWLVIGPLAGSFLIATVILLLLRKRWISAVVGSVVSAPFYVYGTGSLVHGLLFANTILAPMEIWIVAPAIFTVLSFIFAVRQRIA